MTFENLKVIWNEQHSEKLYALDQGAFQRHILEKCQITETRSKINTITLAVVFGVTGLILVLINVWNELGTINLAATLPILGIAAYAIARHLVLSKKQVNYEEDINRALDQAISTHRNHIRLSQTMPLWIGLPYLTFAGLQCLSMDSNPPAVWYLVTFGALALMYLAVEYGLRHTEYPRLKELQTLRAKYSESPGDSSE